MFSRVLITLTLLAAPSIVAAAPATYSHGVVTCPDGSKAPLHVAPFTQPTASQISGVCLSKQANKALQPQPLPPRPMTREEIDRQAAGLIGKPK